MKTHLLYWAAVLGAACLLAGCQNMGQYSPEYRAVHEREFDKHLTGGGVDAVAVANLWAHTIAEREVGK